MIEKKLGRPGQRVLCSKHIIETLWKRFFRIVDTGAKGPESFDGPIGKQLGKGELRFKNIVKFKKVKGNKMGRQTGRFQAAAVVFGPRFTAVGLPDSTKSDRMWLK